MPVTAADVINLGESISAKIDTLIDRATVMVDATSPYTQFELGLAVSRSQESPRALSGRPCGLYRLSRRSPNWGLPLSTFWQLPAAN